jgi:hypothetical protein
MSKIDFPKKLLLKKFEINTTRVGKFLGAVFKKSLKTPSLCSVFSYYNSHVYSHILQYLIFNAFSG